MSDGDDQTEPSVAMASVLVSVDDERGHDVSGVAKRLSDIGMRVEATMELLGTVSGSIEPGRIDALRAVEGVSDVERSRSYQLPPRESPVQ